MWESKYSRTYLTLCYTEYVSYKFYIPELGKSFFFLNIYIVFYIYQVSLFEFIYPIIAEFVAFNDLLFCDV